MQALKIATLSLYLALISGCMSAVTINNQDNDNCQEVAHCSDIAEAIRTDLALTAAITEEILTAIEKPKPLPSRHHAVCDIDTEQKICSAIDGCRCAPLKAKQP